MLLVLQKRSIRKKARKFKVLNGELFYLNGHSCKSKVNVNDILYRYSNINILQTPIEVRYMDIRNKEEQQRILKACHLDPTSGHMGGKRTLARITERFMWPGVVKSVENLVS